MGKLVFSLDGWFFELKEKVKVEIEKTVEKNRNRKPYYQKKVHFATSREKKLQSDGTERHVTLPIRLKSSKCLLGFSSRLNRNPLDWKAVLGQ
ncbi:unnamed protein product [Taenia asiatica]|uniref:Transposase n=1 Tax=Taenia asiatica TaxID=60517 RepID=A0A0R3VVA5_TAEAS|nr:unnamed protein product [Taenia asiatica]